MVFCTDGYYSEGAYDCEKCPAESTNLGTTCASCETNFNGNCIVTTIPHECEGDELELSSGPNTLCVDHCPSVSIVDVAAGGCVNSCAANNIRYTESVECSEQDSVAGMIKTGTLVTY